MVLNTDLLSHNFFLISVQYHIISTIITLDSELSEEPIGDWIYNDDDYFFFCELFLVKNSGRKFVIERPSYKFYKNSYT